MDLSCHAGPEEALADAVEGFVAAEVGSRRTGMVSVEYGFAERLGNNNERHRMGGGEQSLVHTEVRVVEGDCIGSEVWVVGRVHGCDQIFRPGSSRVVSEVSQ